MGSNHGASVEISAPGWDVVATGNTGTTTPGSDEYVYGSGTSAAAPHVSGVISLMFSLNPKLTPTQVQQILQNTVKTFPAGGTYPCTTSNCGAGIVNAGAALNAVPAGITGFSPTSGWIGRSITISGANLSRVTSVRFNGVSAAFRSIRRLLSVQPCQMEQPAVRSQ
jgi:serine protease